MGKMHFGEHPLLEAEADRLIREGMRGITKHSDKADILTTWKAGDRRRREVFVSDGVPDRAVRQGMFHRNINPRNSNLNSRDGIAQAGIRFRTGDTIDSLSGFVEGYLEGGD
jgi:hypothetical protein